MRQHAEGNESGADPSGGTGTSRRRWFRAIGRVGSVIGKGLVYSLVFWAVYAVLFPRPTKAERDAEKRADAAQEKRVAAQQATYERQISRADALTDRQEALVERWEALTRRWEQMAGSKR